MSDTAPVLPLELIVEILSWLPVKPLMRFRMEEEDVDETDIINGAALCSINRLLENPSSTIDDSLNQFHDTNFIGTCNGLVCFKKYDGKLRGYRFQFWNPATRIMSECSPPLCDIYGDGFGPLNCGFGFDELSNTYKVVVVLKDIRSHTREVRVHSLGDTCWRKILTCPTFSLLGCYDGQLASGTVNWLALRMSGFDYRWTTVTVDQLVIFSYDLRNETYRYLLMPEGFVEGPLSEEPYFMVLKGCLCLAHDHPKTHLVVWLMREFGVEKSWTQLLKVNYELLGFQSFRGKPLCMSQDEDVVLLMSTNARIATFVLYNRRDNRIEHCGFTYDKFSFFCYDYVQSLVLPH